MTPERITGPDDAAACARMMSTTEPWPTLKRDYEQCLAIISDPDRETYVARGLQAIRGFIILDMRGPLRGYIQALCIADGERGKGLGTELIAWAERRIARDSPHVFICVSSFNGAAQRLYLRLGFRMVGRLPAILVPGHDELLLMKSTGPWSTFRSSAQ